MNIIQNSCRQMLTALVTAGFISNCIANADAAQQLFACTLLPGSASLLLSEADQIAVDVERQTVDLRVARTMGTTVPEDWQFASRKTALENESFSVIQMGSSIVGAGIRDAAAHAFELDSGILTWTMVVMHESLTMSWRCRESPLG